ncbi:MAG: pseudoazurin [Pseudomonadota bacterium]
MRKLMLIFLLLFPTDAFAEVYNVQMLNRNDVGAMVYEPGYLKISPGDTVKFIASKPGHNAASIDSLWPEAVETFRGKINEEIEIKFEKEGIYGIKCTPHLSVGMVMIIQVGDERAKPEQIPDDMPRRAKERLILYITESAD